MSEKTKKRVAQWSQKLGIPVADLMKQYGAAVTKLKKLYPKQTEEFYDNRARHNLATKFAADLRPRARAVVGVFFVTGAKINTTARMAEMAKQAYQEDPAQAVASWLTNNQGVPLDTREELTPGRKNPFYRKELKPFWQRSAIGVFKKFGEKTVKLCVATLRQEQADLEIVENEPIQLRLNIRTDSKYLMVCTSSTRTEIEPSDDPDFADWTLERSIEMLDKCPIKVSPLNLTEYYDNHKKAGEPVIFAVIEGDILTVADEPTSTGNYRCELGDVEADIEARPATMFVPPDLFEGIKDVGLGSKLLTINRLTLGTDMTTGERTQVNLNPVFIHVKYLVTKEESLLEFEEVESA